MERFGNCNSERNLLGTARKLGMVFVALAVLAPIQAMAQVYTCNSAITVNALGDEPFFVNEAIPIVITLSTGTISNGSEDGVLHVEELDFKPDCQTGTTFDTCAAAGNTVDIDGPITTSCMGGAPGDTPGSISFSASDVNATTILLEPSQDVILGPQDSCTVNFNVVVTDTVAETASITEAAGWVRSQVTCYETSAEPPPPPYPDFATPPQVSGETSFAISTERVGFIVAKAFADQSDGDATMRMQCNGGFPSSGEYPVGHLEWNEFVVKEYIAGDLDCRVWEEPVPDGYVPVYSVSDANGSAANVYADETGCYFEGVETGIFNCDVINNIGEVEITINKQWTEGIEDLELPFELTAEAEYTCYNVFTTPDGAGGETDVSGTISFSGAFDSYVITGVYPANRDSYCEVTEVTPVEEYIDADDSECERVPVLDGESCTIRNTIFFEGIPTLDRYGLALMALLMLGVGLVGFRRFA